MKEISMEKRFDLYMDTLEKCGTYYLSDEMIGYYIFEEFDVGAISFLHENNMLVLVNDGVIDNDIYFKSQILRKKFMALQGTELWNIDSVKKSLEWKEILQLSDKIKELINQKWSDEECDYLRGNK